MMDKSLEKRKWREDRKVTRAKRNETRNIVSEKMGMRVVKRLHQSVRKGGPQRSPKRRM